MSIKYIDAKRLRRVLVGGGNWLKNHEQELNDLNVYPVPDGDTGTNMAMTVDSMIKDINEHTDKKTSMETLVEIVEEAVLMGARGNSGTILSQIITGFLKGTKNKRRLLKEDVKEALISAKNVAYNAVDTPVEGTILTVIREISEEAERIYKENIYLDEFIKKIVLKAKESVEKTPDLLPKLKEANVVDSGAKGLYYFFQGIEKTITEIDSLINFNKEEREFNKQISEYNHNIEDIKFQYCTEFVIKNLNKDKNIDELKQEILKLGDSQVFAITSKKFKTHVHTNNPGLALEFALQYGELEKVKIENMKLQNEELVANSNNIFVNNKKISSKYAYITVADSYELKDTFLKLGADVVILGGQGKNPSTQDFIEAINKVVENKEIIILPNNKNIIATAKLAVEKLEQNIVLQETYTMLEGYYYLLYRDFNLKNLTNDFKENYSIEITRAVRDTKIDDLIINNGDYLAIVNGKIKLANVEIADLFDEIKERYISEKTRNITIVEGLNKSESIDIRFENLKKEIKGDFNIIKSSMDNYNYYILIENIPSNLPEVAIVTDSSCDLEEDEIKNYPIYIVPLKVEIDGNHYLENIDYTKEELWQKLLSGKDFKTAQPSPKSLTNMYNKLFRKGYKRIMSIHISKGLSGTVQTANIAKETSTYPNLVEVFDSKSIGFQIGLLLVELSKRILEKKTYIELRDYIFKYIEKSKVLIFIDNLDQVVKGGRMSATTKSFADFIGIKPVITMLNGNLVVEKKVIGENSALKYIEKQAIEYSNKNSLYLYGAYAGSPKMKEYMLKVINSLKNVSRINIINDEHKIGTAIGAHSGPIFAILLLPRLM